MNVGWVIVGTVLTALGMVGVVTWWINDRNDTPLALVQAGMAFAGLFLIAWAAS